jgi:hypothetical protein
LDEDTLPELSAKMSDHYVIIATAPRHVYKATRPQKKKILVRTGKISATAATISDFDFSEVMAQLDIDPQATISNVYALILAAQDFHQPLRVVQIRGDKEWMTPGIKSLIRSRQQAKTDEQRQQLAHQVVSAIRRRKYAFYKSRYAVSKASMWRQATSLRTAATSSQLGNQFGLELNEQFSERVWHGIEQPDLSVYINSSGSTHPDYPAGLQLFNCTNVAEQFATIGNCTAGPDLLSGKLLCLCKGKLIPIFTKLFNHFLMTSFCPTEWTFANITAIPKVPNATAPPDYRPIAITSTACKMFERIVAKYILNTTSNILSDNKQYGFLPGRCTMDAVIQAIDHWGQALDKKDKVLAIFFDFAKAFDLVDHKILLNKLTASLPTWLLSWLAAYLTNRQQRVMYNHLPTEWKQVKAGVIQGSVLGPILFLLFIVDINDYLPTNINLLKYADDILAYIMGKDCLTDLPAQIVEGIQQWCDDNKMRLNTSKCKVLTIGLGRDPPPVLLNNSALENVTTYKYLGIDLNAKLDPAQQWQRVYHQVCTLPFLFKKLKLVGWSKKMLLSAYRAYGLSHFVYSAPVLMSCSKKDKLAMLHFQNKLLKIIGVDQATAATQHNITTISERIDEICKRIFERIISEPSHPITSSIKTNPRKRNQLCVPAARTQTYHNSFLPVMLRTKRDGTRSLYSGGPTNIL